MTKEHPIFMLVSDDIRGGLSLFFKSNNCFPFPNDIDVEKDFPEIHLVVDTIESLFAEDIAVYLYSDATTPVSVATDIHSEEIIIATQKSVYTDNQEILWYMITPLGVFYFYFLLTTSSGSLVEIDSVELNEEMREFLFLAPCEVGFPEGDMGEASILHVYPPSMQFPPLPPSSYLIGSELRAQSEIFYEFRKIKEKELEDSGIERDPNGDFVYCGGDDWNNDEDKDDDEDFCQTQTIVFETTFYVIRPED